LPFSQKSGGSNQQNRHNAFSQLIAPIAGHFQLRRHRLPATEYRFLMQERFQMWDEVTETKTAA
jgi:putative transposase